MAFMAGGRCVMGGPPPKAIWPFGVILRPAILVLLRLSVLVRSRGGGVDAARAGGLWSSYAQSSLGAPGGARNCTRCTSCVKNEAGVAVRVMRTL